MTSMTAALIQCMSLRGQGCSRPPAGSGDAARSGAVFPMWFMNVISALRAGHGRREYEWPKGIGVECKRYFSPSRQSHQNGPSQQGYDRASDRVPDGDVERIIRRAGEEKDKSAPGRPG